MTDFLPPKRHRRSLHNIPLAPVLDLLTVVIFFLMLSTSFVELTKQTLPPSSVIQVTEVSAPTPINLKLFVVRKGGDYAFTYRWTGDVPGVEKASLRKGQTLPKNIREQSADLGQKVKAKFPTETNVQLGLGGDFTYQEMIAVMDGVREHFDDVVLVSPKEAEDDAL